MALITPVIISLLVNLFIADAQQQCYSCVYVQVGDPEAPDSAEQQEMDNEMLSDEDMMQYSRKCMGELSQTDGDLQANCNANQKCIVAKGTARVSETHGSATVRGCYENDDMPVSGTCKQDEDEANNLYLTILQEKLVGYPVSSAMGDVCACDNNRCNNEEAHLLVSCHACYYIRVGESGSELQATLDVLLGDNQLLGGLHTEQCQDDVKGSDVIVSDRSCDYRETCTWADGVGRINAPGIERKYYGVLVRGCDRLHFPRTTEACTATENATSHFRQVLYTLANDVDNFGVSSDVSGDVCSCDNYYCNFNIITVSGCAAKLMTSLAATVAYVALYLV